MGIISSIKQVLGKSLDVDRLKQQTIDVKQLASDVFSKQKPKQIETFEEALERLNLRESDIEKRTREFKRLVKVFSGILLGLFVYLIYVLFQKAWIASLGTLGIMLVVVAQLFRYHFWLFQIQERRLGCTFKEWLGSLRRKNEGAVHE